MKTSCWLSSNTPGSWWAATVAIYCPGMMKEHPKSKSIRGFYHLDVSPCILHNFRNSLPSLVKRHMCQHLSQVERCLHRRSAGLGTGAHSSTISRTLHRFSRQINVTLRAPNPRFDFSNMAPRVFGGWICNLRPSDVSPSKVFASRGIRSKKKCSPQLLRLKTSRSWTCKSSSTWDYEEGH